jgi:hypothetical protein
MKIIVNHPKGSYVKTLSFGDGHLGFPIIHAQFLLTLPKEKVLT